MQLKIAINFGYSFTHYNLHNNNFNTVPTVEAMRFFFRGVNKFNEKIRDWIEYLLNPGTNIDLTLIIPNAVYNNKTICNELKSILASILSIYTLKIISECESIAAYLFKNGKNNEAIRVIDFGQTTIQIHDLQLKGGKFHQLNSSEILLENKKSLAEQLGQHSDSYFGKFSSDEFYKSLNSVYDEFKRIKEEDTDYMDIPIKKGSQIRFQHLDDVFKKIGKEYAEKIPGNSSLKKENIIFCGGPTGSSFFMHYVAEGAAFIQDFRYIKVIGGLVLDHSIYRPIENDIKIRTYNPKKVDMAIYSPEGYTGHENTDYRNHDFQERQYNVAILDTIEPQASITLSYGDQLFNYKISERGMDALKSICLINNNSYKWRKIKLSVSVDGCHNLVVHFGTSAQVIFSDIVGKI